MYLGLLINDWRHLSIDLLCHYILDRILLLFTQLVVHSHASNDSIFLSDIGRHNNYRRYSQEKKIESLFHVTSCNVTRYLLVFIVKRETYLFALNKRMQEKETDLSRQSFYCNQCKSNCFCILIWQDNLLRVTILSFTSNLFTSLP